MKTIVNTRAAVHCLRKSLHIVAHVALLAATSFPADIVPLAAEDTNSRLETACRADKDARKVDLGIRVYRHDNAEQSVLPVVRMAEDMLRIDRLPSHEYLPIPRLADFTSAATRLISINLRSEQPCNLSRG